MVMLLALAAAFGYGTADFLGGLATRRAWLLPVLLVTSASGVVVQVLAALGFGGPPSTAGLGWGILAGVCGAVGLAFFYAGLAAGPMTVVSPLSALISTVVPVGFAVAAGERPGMSAYLGGLLCLAATVLVSTAGTTPETLTGKRPDPVRISLHGKQSASVRVAAFWRGRARGVVFGVASGTAFGLFFLFIRNGGESGAFWPVVAARSAGLMLYLLAAAALRAKPVTWRAGWQTFGAAVAAGLTDATANLCYVLATRAGMLGLAVVLTSLYPAVTVVAARLVLRERMRRVQQAGLVLAAIGVVLVSA